LRVFEKAALKEPRVRIFHLSWVILLAVLISCSSVVAKNGSTLVRVANRSERDFERVVVTFPEGKREYGKVTKGTKSEYYDAPGAYGYAPVDVAVGGESLHLQPQDYLGEKPLRPGRYTYALSIDESGHGLRLELVKD
jgi:glycine cleavage system aminomethyltransferase T